VRLRTFCIAGALGGTLSLTGARPVSVRVTASHPGLAARITGPNITIVNGSQIRAGPGFVVLSTPADVVIDPGRGDYFFRLEPDTAWVSVDVQAEATSMSASARIVVVAYEGTGLVVAGVPPQPADKP